jgi:hypothetical protein
MSNGNSPAFPCQDSNKQIYTGMNLRDYFALEAMSAIIESAAMIKLDEVPNKAYKIADLMLEERQNYK